MFVLCLFVSSFGYLGAVPLIASDYGLIFTCRMDQDNSEVPLFFYSEDPSGLQDGKSTSMLESILTYASSVRAFKPELPYILEGWSVSMKQCEVQSYLVTVTLPVSHFFHNETLSEFSVADIASDSKFFSIVDSFALYSHPINAHRPPIEGLLSAKGPRPDSLVGCPAGGRNRITPRVQDSKRDWSFQLQALSMPWTDGAHILPMSTVKGRLSYITKGLVLPEKLYDYFLDRLSAVSIHDIIRGESRIFIKSCYETDPRMLFGLPSLVLTFIGANSSNVEILPHIYMQALQNKECELDVYKSSGDTVILGDAFFRAGLTQISSDKSLVVCPASMYVHPSSKAASPGGLPANSSVDIVGKNDDPDGIASKVIIGVTVGGIVFICALVAFFIIRARRRNSTKNRDDPARFMIKDPSVIGSDSISVAESLPPQRVVV